jgi:cytochrome c oxidase assembly protein subunit 11
VTHSVPPPDHGKQHTRRNTVAVLIGIVVGMLSLSFASVPLYRLFCQKTGFGGTPKMAMSFSAPIKDRRFKVRFTADVSPDLPWAFRPLQKEIEVYAGEQAFALYHVENLSDEPLIGVATYNVTPDKAGGYFNKVECFCFLEQKIEPHQSVDMPLLFYIDSEIIEDTVANDVSTITLSYTFFKYKGNIKNLESGVRTHRTDS